MANRFWKGIGIAGLMLLQVPLSSAESCVDDCVPVGEWQVNVGLGFGWRNNPLHDGQDSPMFVLPQISYYGERFFLENMEMGWMLFENSQHQINLLLTPSADQQYFNQWDPYNLFDSNGAGSAPQSYNSSRVSLSYSNANGLDQAGAEGSSSASSISSSPSMVPPQQETEVVFDNVESVSINGREVDLSGDQVLTGVTGNEIRVAGDEAGWSIEGIQEGDQISIQQPGSGVGGADERSQANYQVINGELQSLDDGQVAAPSTQGVRETVSVEDVKDRKIAVLAGLEYLYSTERLQLHGQILGDVSGVHSGYEVRTAAIIPWELQSSRWAVTLGASYKSHEVLDYYYGVRADDTPSGLLLYEPVSAGVATMLRLDWQKPLSEKWSLRAMLQHTRLPSQVHDSPLVADESVTSFFFGGVYHF